MLVRKKRELIYLRSLYFRHDFYARVQKIRSEIIYKEMHNESINDSPTELYIQFRFVVGFYIKVNTNPN